ncbi:MAG: hypothetical protein ABI586_06125 [Candidatus Nanopelagicales bacterium]
MCEQSPTNPDGSELDDWGDLAPRIMIDRGVDEIDFGRAFARDGDRN